MIVKTLSIVIPVYNEERLVKPLLDRVGTAQVPGYRIEIIIVDDGSTDQTLPHLKTSQHKIPFTLIELPRNAGKCVALKAGFAATTGDVVVVLDGDLEYDPDDLPELIEPFDRHGADVVYGSRFMGQKPHRVLYHRHYIANRFLTSFSNFCSNLNLTDMETGYKAFRGDIIRKIGPELRSRRFGFEPEITARIAKIKGIRIFEVGISYSGRTYEEGKKIGLMDGIRAVWEIVRFNVFE